MEKPGSAAPPPGPASNEPTHRPERARSRSRNLYRSLPRLDRRLGLLLVASIVIPTVLLIAVAIQYRHDLERDARRNATGNANLMREEVGGLIRARSVLISRIEEHIAGQDWESIASSTDLPTYLAVVAKQAGSAESIALVDPSGRVRAASFPLGGQPMDYRDHDFLDPGPEGNAIMVSRLHPDLGLDGWGFAIAKRRGTGGGTIVIGVSVNHLFDFDRKLTDKPGESAVLIDDTGGLIVRFPPLGNETPMPMPSKAFIDAIRESPEGVFYGTSQLTGEPRLVAFDSIPGTRLHVAFGHGLYEVQAEWRRSIIGFILLSLPAALGLVIVSVIVMGQVGQERRTAERLAEALEQLRQAQKMEALGRLTGGVAHDFNNFLTVIGGNVSLLREPDGDPRRHDRLLDAVERAVERATGLTRHLLAFARRQPLEPRAIDLNELIRSLLELLVRSLPSTIRVATDLEGRLWRVVADPIQLETAILNVAFNARDAMPDGGTLSISTRNDMAAAQVSLTIADTGTGMPAEVVASAFEPFFTTKPVGRGTGLGLSQVYGFIQQSGGRITLDSEPGAGTTVRIHLPRATGAVLPHRRPGLSEDRLPLDDLTRILVIEPEDGPTRATSALLEDAGFLVRRWVGDGSVVNEDDVDLIVSDIPIDGVEDGIAVVRHLRERLPDVPILVTSVSPDALEDVREAGFPVLAKPFTRQDLLDAIRRLRHSGPTGGALSPEQAIG